ncbi:MAG: carboxypeptidase regulatory-like domain-containing protein [Vicinamibacterales bacterium]
MRDKCSRALRSSPCRPLATIVATLIAVLAIPGSDATAQSLTLEYQQVATRQVPGATAAMSLDPARVAASVHDGLVTLVGRGPGSTNVVVMAGDETITLNVLVAEPPVIVLPGMRSTGAQNGSTGYYEGRYGSDPGIFQGTLFVSRRDGDRTAELTLGGAAPFGRDIASPFSIPQATFTLRSPNREITLLDRVISNSPLTISRSNVRGLYLREGPWQVNAGYSFFSTFEHLLLPIDKQAVAGVAYRHHLSPRTSLTPNLFYFDGTTRSGRRGALGTLLYETRTASDVRLLAELGVSRSVGGALEVELDRPNNRAWAKVRIAPPELPSLTTDQQSGRQVEGGWVWQGDKSGVNAMLSSRHYTQGRIDQTSSVASVDLQRRLTERWAIHGGSGVSLFENAAQTGSRINSLALPVGASFSGRYAGASLDYQFSRETTRDLGGHLVRVNLNGSARGFRLSASGERQTQAPTARRIFTEIPWLQPMLDRLGVAASTPQQLADLLRTNAELASYGYANDVQIDVTPVRTRLGASGGWAGSGASRPQLSVSTLFNRDEAIERTSVAAVHSLSYSQRLGSATDVFFTWSALCHDRFLSSSCRPVVFGAMRRTLNSGPDLLMARRGHIDGIVFRDDQVQGMYTPGMALMAGVEVILDNVRSTRTDSSGRFRFEDVPYGRHRVEARYASSQPTFFTTPSPTDVDTGSSVQFGVALSRSTLRGVVLTDAGTALPGILVRIASADRRTTVRTADDGTFVEEGLLAGDYDVSIEAGSVPAGYPVDNLTPQRVRVDQNAPGRARFVLRPYRSVAGRARLFNRDTGQYVALGGATVEILPLRQQSVTDANGQYAFRNLPAGEYTVVAKHDGRDHSVAVRVPDGPALVKNIDLAVLPAAAVAAGAGSQGVSTPEQRAASAEVIEAHVAADEAPVPKSPGAVGVFTIQVAESTNVRHAMAMVTELKHAGHAAYLEPPISGSGSMYRLRVGHYSSLADANRSARTLEKALGWRMSVLPVASEFVTR